MRGYRDLSEGANSATLTTFFSSFFRGERIQISLKAGYLDDRYSNLFLNAYINRHARTECLKMIGSLSSFRHMACFSI